VPSKFELHGDDLTCFLMLAEANESCRHALRQGNSQMFSDVQSENVELCPGIRKSEQIDRCVRPENCHRE